MSGPGQQSVEFVKLTRLGPSPGFLTDDASRRRRKPAAVEGYLARCVGYIAGGCGAVKLSLARPRGSRLLSRAFSLAVTEDLVPQRSRVGEGNERSRQRICYRRTYDSLPYIKHLGRNLGEFSACSPTVRHLKVRRFWPRTERQMTLASSYLSKVGTRHARHA